MKYIIFESPVDGFFPVVFPEHIQHDFIRNSIHSEYPGIKAVSAGFCSIILDRVLVWGKSLSLQLRSKPEDLICIEQMVKQESLSAPL